MQVSLTDRIDPFQRSGQVWVRSQKGSKGRVFPIRSIAYLQRHYSTPVRPCSTKYSLGMVISSMTYSSMGMLLGFPPVFFWSLDESGEDVLGGPCIRDLGGRSGFSFHHLLRVPMHSILASFF